MPAFWRSYDPVARGRLDEQAAALAKGFFEPQKAVYERAGIHRIDLDSIARWLTKVSHLIPDMRRLHQRFAADYGRYVSRFEQAFPDFNKGAWPIYFLPSLLHFDGHLQQSEGELPLFFGVDGIVQFHGPNPNLGVLFAHETFHCYQAQQNPGVVLADKSPLYTALWGEGGATWISERLNPHASELSVLLDDRALLATSREQLEAAAGALLIKFDSLDDADAKPFFTAGWSGSWPARVGYLIGLQIARRVGPTMSIQRFVRLSLTEMRSLYARQVQAIATSAHADGAGHSSTRVHLQPDLPLG
jgi:Putative zinc dependent peptidase (DUF5700)